jgi:TetR/AcrR family transcriptional repressor of nem operon
VRKSNKEAAETRRAIIAVAADHIRRGGIAETSLSDIMSGAGLTHGGFYKHFRSKEQLVTEALETAGAVTAEQVRAVLLGEGRDAAIDNYLSPAHRDASVPTCPMAALGSEAARAEGETKAAAAHVIEKMVSALADHSHSRGDAMVDYATMIGAMTLARILSDTPLSDEVLERARSRLKQR